MSDRGFRWLVAAAVTVVALWAGGVAVNAAYQAITSNTDGEPARQPDTRIAAPPEPASSASAAPPTVTGPEGQEITAPPAPARPAGQVARRPVIVDAPIPFDAERKQQMAAYAERHYGVRASRLEPRVLVEHFTVTETFQAAWEIFARNIADPELNELPGTCAHFIVDRDGTIYQLVPLSLMCRHTVGLNDRAIGIEHVGMSAQEILSRPRQVRAIVALSAWLRCRYGIQISDVIGHAESLSSPYRHENVAALANQTHSDWTTNEAQVLRKRIERNVCP